MADDPKHSFHKLVVSDIVNETGDARSFAFAIPDELRELFEYQAGQFLTFRVPWNGMVIQRSYSLCSSPERREAHRVAIKRVDDGRVSNWFNDSVKVGDRLEVLPPEGRFVLTESDRPLLLYSGGSGITPVISLIKSALSQTKRRIKLVYANRDRGSIIFGAELEALVRDGDRLELVHHLDAARGFLDVPGAVAHAAGWEEAEVYICGPAEFMDVVESALESLGIERSRVHVERFVSPTDADRAQPQTAVAAPAGDSPTEITIALDGSTHQVPYIQGRTLLETARDAGLMPPFACEEGYCSTCMARLMRGTVLMRVNDALSQRDLDDGWILTCQGVPTSGECQIDYDAT
jgi:3-ketosteroid 9alpha-monooxygenase subunit B